MTSARDGLSEKRRALLSALLAAEGVADGDRERIRRVPDAPHHPVSFAQRRLWFLDQLAPGNPFYNVASAVPIAARIHPEALERSLQQLCARHDSLRTTFAVVDGRPVQVVAPSLDLRLAQIDVRELPAGERERRIADLASEEAQRPFDLERGPLVRATLVRADEERFVLLLTLHHIVCDGWSMDILSRDLSALYEANLTGAPARLPALPIRYVDYAAWQARWLEGAEVAAQAAYWRRQLADVAELQLPTDRPRPAVATYRGAQVEVRLPAVAGGLAALCKQEGATTFMALLAAFAALLHRYAGQADISVGAPISGRNRVEIEDLIGFFVNTLVLRVDLAGDPSYRELLRRTRAVATEAYAHQDLPFERLVEDVQPRRDLSRNPLFQVMLQYLDPLVPESGQAPPADVPEVRRGVALFDLALHLAQRGDGYAGRLEYSTDLFDESTARRMVGHLATLLSAAVADPDRPVAALPLMDDAERAEVAAASAGPAPRRHALVMDQLRAAAADCAGAVALRFGDVAVTYGELQDRVRELARRIRLSGARPGDRVAVCLPRSLEAVIALPAVLEAGAAYQALDPAEPAPRAAVMLRGARVVITDAARAAGLPAGTPRLLVDEPGPTGDEPEVAPAAGDIAYVVYTSGSTGEPKGVAMPHGALANLIAWQVAHPGFRAGATVAQYAATTFDVSIQEILSTLCSGGTLVVLDEETRADPWALWDALARERIERIFVPYAGLQQLAEADEGADLCLREVITAGERLRITPAIAALFERLGDCTLDNHYGPSETHVATAHRLSGRPDAWPATPPIGRPIEGVHVAVLDERGAPAPVGVPGEIHVGGCQLALGYLDRPALTAERFEPDALGARRYRTGDRGRLLASGEVEFLGRTDDQVKIRGFRVEPGELEAVLDAHPAVNEAAVVAAADARGEPQLAAFVVPAAANGGGLVPELRRFVADRLPAYLRPAVIEARDALPRTASGKLDRRALTVSEPADGGGAEPRDELEARIAGIWAEALGRERVGVHDDFFTDLGGHSLLATQVVAAVRDAYAVELPLTRLFEAPTVATFAAVIRDAIVAELAAVGDEEGAPDAR